MAADNLPRHYAGGPPRSVPQEVPLAEHRPALTGALASHEVLPHPPVSNRLANDRLRDSWRRQRAPRLTETPGTIHKWSGIPELSGAPSRGASAPLETGLPDSRRVTVAALSSAVHRAARTVVPRARRCGSDGWLTLGLS